jgi:hypothetical protein
MSNAASNDNRQCRVRAYTYLAGLIGDRPHTVTWDSTHCLQGHVRIGRSELVVIAPRDASRPPVVMTEPSWDAVRRCPGEERRNLIRSCAITDGSRLASALTLA